jgi:tetratricopeptide (TPR) repeat protein/predicted Ser/Thr protein kinase
MTSDRPDPSTLHRSLDEAARRQFEQDWREGRPNPIEGYLPPPDSPLHLPTLEELVLIELELRWKARGAAADPNATGPFVEGYLERFPVLNQPEILRRLIGQEQYARRRQGDDPAPEEYQARFPDLTVGENSLETDVGRRTAVPEEFPRLPGYEVLGVLGRGGMGVVYKARQLSLDRSVALKMILGGVHADPTEKARFRREAETLARLQHSNVVQIHEVGEQDALPYLALEFVPGGSLAQALAHRPQPPGQAVALVETLARAVHAVHQRGILHRDLKPANVLLTEDGVPKITDFGLAKRLEGTAGHTRSGDVLGTPAYMAPEQAAGKVKEVGPAADVYALGAILYEMLTGRPPFLAENRMETLLQVLSQEPVAPRRLQPKVPRDLETICLKCLAKEPGRRYESALALAEDLRRFGAGEAIRARPEGALGRLWRKVRRRPLIPAAIVAAFLAAAVAGYAAWVGSSGVREEGLQARRLAELRGKLEAGLKATAWPVRHEQEMDALLEELRRLEDPDQADLVRRVNQRFAEIIDGSIAQARLARADVEAIKASLRRLAVRAPELARSRRQALERRLTEWDPVFELQAPFANPQAVLETAPLRVEAGRLVLQPRAKNGPQPVPVLLTRYPSSGNVRLEAELDLASGPIGEVGLLVGASPGHARPVRALDFSPDAALLASAGEDGTIILWDTTSGQSQATLREPAGEVFCLAFHPSGQTLATGSHKFVRLWDVATGKPTVSWEAHQGPVLTLAFAPDGKLLATGGTDKTARLWDAATGAAQGRPREHPEAVEALAFADGGRSLTTVTQARERLIRVEELATGARKEFRADCKIPEHGVHLSPDGRWVAWCPHFRTMSLWDIRTGTEQPLLGNSLIGPIAFSPDGKLLARATYEPVPEPMFLWDLSSRRQRTTLPQHKGARRLVFSADGSLLASAAGDGSVRLTDVVRGTQRLSFGSRTYAFLVSSPERQVLSGVSPATEPVRPGGRVRLELLRDGVSQRALSVTLPVRTPTLRLRASREGNVLTFQVNDLAPLTFQDVFAGTGSSAGVFGVYATGETRLLALRGSRQARPVERSPLERGDELYERGAYAQALEEFRRQARQPGSAEVGREARCKAALCLLRLRRADEAAPLLEELAADPAGGRWPLAAGYQLLLLRLDQGRLDADTDALLESLSQRYKAEEVHAVIPEDVRRQLLKACDVPPIDYLFFQEAHLQRLQRASAIAARLDAPGTLGLQLKMQLLHGYRLLGRTKEAAAEARLVLEQTRGLPLEAEFAGVAHLIEDACWTLRQHGDRQRLLAELNERLRGDPSVRVLRVERARLHAALGNWTEAEKDLDRALRPTLAVPAQADYVSLSAACLMKGFLCEQRGDAAGARRVWQRGLFKTWYEGILPPARRLVSQKNPMTILHSLIVGSLADELSDAEAAESVTLLTAGRGDSMVGQMLKSFRLPPETLRAMWRTPRGRAYARKIAFRDLTFPEFIRGPVYLTGVEILRLGALAGPASPEQEELIWGAVQDMFNGLTSGKVEKFQFLQVGLAWKGQVGQLGWAGVSGKLAPSLRGPLAYLLGHRYLRLNRPADAPMFFRTALADAAPGSALQRLAQAELDRLQKR